MKKIITTLTLLFAFQCAMAHTMWMETNNKATLGNPVKISVYFGEFSSGNPTPSNHWFSDIADYQLMMTAPDGHTTTLDKVQDSLCYTSVFTPTQEGVYTFWFSHEVKDIYNNMKLTYESAAYVNVGSKKETEATIGEGAYQMLYKKGNLYLQKDRNVLPNEILEIVEEKKESHNITTAQDGAIKLPKNWKGRYLIEIPQPQTVENATHNGKPYTTDYKVLSYFITQ